MNAHQLLHKLAAKHINRDQARVLLSLAERGKTVEELTKENPGLNPSTVHRMLDVQLKRQKIGRAHIYRLTESGMNTVKLIFDEETTPTTGAIPDSPPLPFSQTA